MVSIGSACRPPFTVFAARAYRAAIIAMAGLCITQPVGASSIFSPDWTGLYLGGSIGARKDQIDWSALNANSVNSANARASLDSQTARLGGFTGLNL